MQKRHTDREQYFKELAATCKKYYIPFLDKKTSIGRGTKVLEIGCGDGGNLLPFLECGCDVTGIEISPTRISQAKSFFEKHSTAGRPELECADIFKWHTDKRFDIILLHDVIEHIHDKAALLGKIEQLLTDDGLLFCGFPAWQMPFGGHQQICADKLLSHLPFIHLLPARLYRRFIKWRKESDAKADELIDIKDCRVTVESFEKIIKTQTRLTIRKRTLWLINPHYEIKFGLKPVRLACPFDRLAYIRNYMSTSCFYLIGK